MTIEISSNAAKEIARMQQAQARLGSSLRLQVKQGGCSGLFYCLKLEAKPTSEISDRIFESQGIPVVVDAQSYSLLEGTKLDYAEDLMGGGFRFQNPQAKITCSCGVSFQVSSEVQVDIKS